MTATDTNGRVKFPVARSTNCRFAAMVWILGFPLFLIGHLCRVAAHLDLYEYFWRVRNVWLTTTITAFGASLAGTFLAAVVLSRAEGVVVSADGIGRVEIIKSFGKFLRWEQIRSIKTLSAFGVLYLHIRHSAGGLPLGMLLPVRGMPKFAEMLTQYVPADCPLQAVLPQLRELAVELPPGASND